MWGTCFGHRYWSELGTRGITPEMQASGCISDHRVVCQHSAHAYMSRFGQFTCALQGARAVDVYGWLPGDVVEVVDVEQGCAQAGAQGIPICDRLRTENRLDFGHMRTCDDLSVAC